MSVTVVRTLASVVVQLGRHRELVARRRMYRPPEPEIGPAVTIARFDIAPHQQGHDCIRGPVTSVRNSSGYARAGCHPATRDGPVLIGSALHRAACECSIEAEVVIQPSVSPGSCQPSRICQRDSPRTHHGDVMTNGEQQ
jgi:hypothetical protein